MNRYYAVKVGRTPGIYNSWNECNLQVKSFSGAKYKSFSTMDEAKAYLGQEPEIIPEGIPYAYVDGSFNAIGTGIYGYGGFLMDGDTKYILTGSGDDEEQAKMRNVTGEICGAMAAVEKAVELGIKELIIYYDYEGVAAWAKHEWKANKPGTAAYVDFMDRSKVKLYFKHVTAHTGVAGNEEAVAAGIDLAHDENTSILSYNDENSLACVLAIAYYYARNDYIFLREFPSGKGYADIVLIPRENVKTPALVIELKYDSTVDTAIEQIKNKQYPAKISEYTGNILLVGINYNKQTKKHTCRIQKA